MNMSAPAQGYFVTGTDTGVGKTLVASALIAALQTQGQGIAGMKPVAAGAIWKDGAWFNEDVEALTSASALALPADLVCPYLLTNATAPHLAAAAQGIRLDIGHIVDCFDKLRALADGIVVEGAGGFMVPLDRHAGLDDLAAALGLPVILVVGIRLGCISHALLTASAIESRGLQLAGWVANIIDADMLHLAATLESLQQRIRAPMLAFIPRLDTVDAVDAVDLAGRIDLSLLAESPVHGAQAQEPAAVSFA